MLLPGSGVSGLAAAAAGCMREASTLLMLAFLPCNSGATCNSADGNIQQLLSDYFAAHTVSKVKYLLSLCSACANKMICTGAAHAVGCSYAVQ